MDNQNTAAVDDKKFNWGEGVFSALDAFLDGIRAGKGGQGVNKAAAAPKDNTTMYLAIGGGFVLLLILIVVIVTKK